LTSGSWSFDETTPVSGTSYSNSYQLDVPDSIGGVWHVEVTAKDEVGYSVSKVISLNVVNNNLPTISLVSSSPEISNDGYMYATVGNTVNVIATAHDADNLSSVYVRLVDHSGTTLNQQNIPVSGTKNIPVSGTTTSFGPVSYTGSLAGDYRIIIDAFDIHGYHAVWDTRLKVQ